MEPPTIRSFIPLSLLLTLAGLGGAGIVLLTTMPTVGPRWLLFFFIFLSLTGAALVPAAFINRRFPSVPPASASAILRQAIWVGTYGCLLAWLQLGGLVTAPLAVMLAVGLILVEWLLRIVEQSIRRK